MFPGSDTGSKASSLCTPSALPAHPLSGTSNRSQGLAKEKPCPKGRPPVYSHVGIFEGRQHLLFD